MLLIEDYVNMEIQSVVYNAAADGKLKRLKVYYKQQQLLLLL